MRILLDANVFIPLEDSSIDIDEKLAELNRLILGKHELMVHPAIEEDIKRDQDIDRKRKMLLRLNKYKRLEDIPLLNSDVELSLFGNPKKDNDHIDNLILFSLYRNCVHWLVTQDNGIHRKAKSLGEEERVLTVDQAINALCKVDEKELRLYPNIKDILCHNIDLNNPFFDSLRESYSGYDDWFNQKCSQEGRHAWICMENNDIHAICIYNEEIDPIINIDNQALPGKSLKLCTFKVSRLGFKIGELLLKQSFNYSMANGIKYIYVTVEPDKHPFLESLFVDFGFLDNGLDRKGRDRVYVKYFPEELLSTDDSYLDYAIKYYPSIKINKNSVYLVPIQPRFHEILFPEIKPQPELFEFPMSSAGNAIKQAYLCKSNTKSIKPGDILIFYRTQDQMKITTYGIVDQFHIGGDPEKILQWVSKRTVYSYKDIEEMASPDIKVILFRQIMHFHNPIGYYLLKKMGIVNGSIQSITRLSIDKAKVIFSETQSNDRVLFN